MSKFLRFFTLLLLLGAGQAQAGQPLFLNLTDLITPWAPVNGTKPYVTASFQDVSSGVVRLTVATAGLQAGDSLKQFLFNYNGTLSALKFSKVSGEVASIATGKDSFYDPLLHQYDIRFKYNTSGNKFTKGETSVYDIKATGISAQSFSVKSNHLIFPTHKHYYAAAEIDRLNGKWNGWVGASVAAVPEPESWAMMMAGLALLGFVGSRRKRETA